MSVRGALALIAHDGKKDELIALVRRHRQTLARHALVATGTTGARVAAETGLAVACVRSGPLGGDAQIAAKVVQGEVGAVVFLVDPLHAHPHEPDIRTVLRVCELQNVPLATNVATAELLLGAL